MLVEGTTEVEFVKRVLAQPLRDHGVAATPVSMGGVTPKPQAGTGSRMERRWRLSWTDSVIVIGFVVPTAPTAKSACGVH